MSTKTVVAHPPRIAVLGGDGRVRPGLCAEGEVVTFRSPKDGGNGDVRRLEAGLRAGSYTKLVILSRWNSHVITRKIRRLCKRLGVAVVVVR
jgi:hypothetical protein